MSAQPADAGRTMGKEGGPLSAPGGERRLRVLRSTSELAPVRDAWLRLQGDEVVTDPDFFEATLLDPAVLRPHVLVLERGGDAEAMLVARIEELRLTSRLGYRTVYAPEVRSITVVNGGILGTVDDDAFRELLASLRASLADGEADIATFRYLPVESPFYRIASTEPPFLARQHVRDSEVRWETELPGSFEELLSGHSGKTRRNLRSYARKLEETYDGRLEVRRYTRPEEIEDFFRDVEVVAPKTYQGALGVALRDTPVQRARTKLCLERGWFRGFVLVLDGLPCSFQYGELYRGRFRLGRPGYDPALSHLRIGTYLLLQVLDELCSDDEARLVDFGIGDAEFKERFGTKRYREGNVLVYTPTLRGARINLTRTALESGIRAAKSIAGRSKLAASLKRRSRRSASAPSGS
jgi:CelD/BcsL family acetyltransferase involved in cellulose biosynthesis